MPFAKGVTETALDHLGDVLYMLADLHPDDQCRAYIDALNFYNSQRPNKIVAPSGFAEVRLSTTLAG